MMTYYAYYLKFIRQISLGKRGCLEIEGGEVIVEKLPFGRGWRFSSVLAQSKPTYFSSVDARLFYDPEAKLLHFVHEVRGPLPFTIFRDTLNRFLTDLAEWQVLWKK